MSQSPYHQKKKPPHHGMMACLLMLAAPTGLLVVPVFLWEFSGAPQLSGDAFQQWHLGLWSLALLVWTQGCIHLALFHGLRWTWGLSGLLFILAFPIIHWAVQQAPKWRIAQARREAKRQRKSQLVASRQCALSCPPAKRRSPEAPAGGGVRENGNETVDTL